MVAAAFMLHHGRARWWLAARNGPAGPARPPIRWPAAGARTGKFLIRDRDAKFTAGFDAGPCRMVSPALEQLARELAGRVKLVKVNVGVRSTRSAGSPGWRGSPPSSAASASSSPVCGWPLWESSPSGLLAFSLPVSGRELLAIAACAACAAVSTCGLGVVAAAVSVRFRDFFTAPNVAESLLLVTSGAIVPAAALPAGLGAIGLVLPLRHAVQAADAVVAGAPLAVSQLGWELLTGLGWAALGYGSLRWMAARARRTGGLYAR